VDSTLSRLDPLEQFSLFPTLVNSSFLTSEQSGRKHKQALVAAADLRAIYKAVDTTRFPTVSGQPYVLHTLDESHISVVVDTGASISVSPNISDFVGPIEPPIAKTLQGLGDTCVVDGQGIIECQIRESLRRPPENRIDSPRWFDCHLSIYG
jgi:hypothetical protein